MNNSWPEFGYFRSFLLVSSIVAGIGFAVVIGNEVKDYNEAVNPPTPNARISPTNSFARTKTHVPDSIIEIGGVQIPDPIQIANGRSSDAMPVTAFALQSAVFVTLAGTGIQLLKGVRDSIVTAHLEGPADDNQTADFSGGE